MGRDGRRNGRSCRSSAVANQVRATRSLISMIAMPLESLGNTIDVVLTDRRCKLQPLYLTLIGERRLRANQSIPSFGQRDNIRMTLNFFNQVSGGPSTVASTYDLVLATRHDVIWEQPITTWTANWSSIAFAFPCE